MIILAVETSCDDTCIAIVEVDKGRLQRGFRRMKINILSDIISSQIKIHRKYGGVYPTLAKREHQRNLIPVLKRALKKAKSLKKNDKHQLLSIKYPVLEEIFKREEYLLKELKEFLRNYRKPKIDLIAVTMGPGLEPCLWVGVNFAKALAFSWELPIIPVNHIEAHIFANLVGSSLKFSFPAVCLVVSGGHTQLILMKNYGEYKILGETRDDAAGECFDKVARILGMDYPGGPAIERLAAQLKSNIQYSIFNIQLPRPMIHQKNFDFSFSGLKTAVLYKIKKQKTERKKQKFIQEMSTEVQQAIVDVLIHKTIQAARKYKAGMIILGGGVAANNELRKQFQLAIKNQRLTIKFLVPPKILCTDNAVMVAVAAYFRYLRKETKAWTPTRPRTGPPVSREGLASRPPSRLWRAPDIEADANLRIS
ncbi:tRNA (adenosine(37)-N6)-threonylcarbamoyltransferase complex transferase subunit TsaD [Patescibacteria group bacterium]|nr:tRNA (adenosine(37)-N6)-threonylcarbamoyltransferase complex transferase subunit TsaD [Patescibacteria group bacterium]